MDEKQLELYTNQAKITTTLDNLQVVFLDYKIQNNQEHAKFMEVLTKLEEKIATNSIETSGNKRLIALAVSAGLLLSGLCGVIITDVKHDQNTIQDKISDVSVKVNSVEEKLNYYALEINKFKNNNRN